MMKGVHLGAGLSLGSLGQAAWDTAMGSRESELCHNFHSRFPIKLAF